MIQPPRSCEVILERRTLEILAKVERFTSKRAACEEAYLRIRGELGRPLLPVDLWSRADVPTLKVFRSTYGTWVECQRANNDLPAWARGLSPDHAAFSFLAAIEKDWQAQRVGPYALVWGLCSRPEDPAAGYADFFSRWPQWSQEQTALTWVTVKKKLGPFLVGERLDPSIAVAIGPTFLDEIERRILYTTNADHQRRHEGVLRTPQELNLFSRYERPDVIRHFGSHYDPTVHNKGILWFGDDGIIIAKIDTSGAVAQHQYRNTLVDRSTFVWTSQNQMGTSNNAGQFVLKHEEEGRRLHLFVQPSSHAPAYYLGVGTIVRATGSGPMEVTFSLRHEVPADIARDLSAASVEGDMDDADE